MYIKQRKINASYVLTKLVVVNRKQIKSIQQKGHFMKAVWDSVSDHRQ